MIANVHQLIEIKPMKVKDYKPLYKTIELFQQLSVFPFARVLCMENVEYINKHYGDCTLLSVMNFHDTKTTGYIIKEFE